MIETLCIAAEITVGVLLVTLAWDRAATSQTASTTSSQPSPNDSIKSRLETLYRIAIGSTARSLMDGGAFETLRQSEHAQGMADLRRELLEMGEEVERDSLTGLGTRLELERWLEGSFQQGGQLAIFDIDGLEVINQRTTMADGDAMLAAYARELEKHLAWLGPIFRVQGGKFACLAPSLRREEMIRILEQFELHYAWHRGEAVETITASGCIVEHSALKDPRGWVTVLEEGIAAAKFSGQAHLAWLHEGKWQSHPAQQPEEATEDVDPTMAGDASKSPSASPSASPPVDSSPVEEPRQEASKEKPNVLPTPSKMEPVEATAVQEAMQPEEVAESKEADKEGDSEGFKQETPSETASVKPAEAPYKVEVTPESMSERATADDIQALLDQLKNGNKPGFGEKASVSETKGKSPAPATSSTVSSPAGDVFEAALGVDSTKTASTDPGSMNVSANNPSRDNTPTHDAEVDTPLGGKQEEADPAPPSITQDDIESLLGNVRTVSSEVQRSTRKEGDGTSAKNSRPIPTGKENAPKELDELVTEESKEETASSGDIEALFAAFSKQK